MSSERLSKLQKWILISCYKDRQCNFHIRADILEFCYGWKNTGLNYRNKPSFDKQIIGEREYNKKQVTLTRALKRLIEKGLLARETTNNRKGLEYFKTTEEGLERGKSLMLNNTLKELGLTLRKELLQ